MRRILLGCMIFFVIQPCCGMGPVKKVSPTAADTIETIINKTTRISDEVTAIPVFNEDHDGSTIVLDIPGNYQLTENLMYPITIAASNIRLDLKNYKIAPSLSGQTAIALTSTTPLQQIYVLNGVLENITAAVASGVYIPANTTKVVLKKMTISGFDKGVWCAGTGASNKVTQCDFSELNLVSNRIGLLFDWSDANIIKQSNAMYSLWSGFELNNCQANCFFDCKALKSTGTATTAGFKSTHGISNVFSRCVSKQTKTSSTTYGDKACGFLLTGSEIKTKALNCVVNETDVVSSPTALSYGVHCAPVFAWGGYASGFPLVPTGVTWAIGSPKWSPDNKYVLTTYKNTSNGYGSNEYTWNGSTFAYIGGSAIGTSASLTAADVAWSPDGKYFVTATADNVGFAGNSPLYAYSFNGTTDTALGSTLPTLNTINLTAVRFSPNGKFIATGGWVFGTNSAYLSIWSFTPSATPALVDLGDKNLGAVGPWQSISWSPDGQYIATVIANAVVVYSVSAAGALSSVAVSSYTFTNAASVAWSPCGKYIAAGDNAGKVQLLTFDGTSSLKFVAQATGLSANYILNLDWSPDGQYIVVPGSDTALTNRVRILQYNGTSTLAVVATSSTNATRMANIAWSPDGKYIVAMDYNAVVGGAVNVHMFNAMYGPANCLIDNCRVCDTQANNFNMGRALVAGGTNVFINNVSANNGINYSYGIPNVYDGRFEIFRTVVQPFDNISMPTTL